MAIAIRLNFIFIMKKILFGLLLILISCNNKNSTIQEKQHIKAISRNIDQESLKLDAEVSFVQLETSKECLLGYIINIEVTDDYIYILDRSSFFVFTNKGNFIKKIKRGKGPGELTRAINFSLDLARNEIYIIEMGNLLHIYNNLADYKETHKLDGSFIDVVRVDDDNFLLYTVLPPKYEEFLISVYNKKSKNITNKFISSKDLLMKDLSILTYNNFFVKNSEIFFSASNSRNIYKYIGNGMETTYSIDFRNLEPPISYFSMFDDVRNFKKMVYNDDYVGFLNYCYDLGKLVLFGFKCKDFNCGIKYKDENIMYMSSVSELFDLPQTPSFERPYNANDNQIHFVYFNDILLNDNLQKKEAFLEIGNKIIQVNENNNPIIVTLKIKEK
jgi:hypothetical protein